MPLCILYILAFCQIKGEGQITDRDTLNWNSSIVQEKRGEMLFWWAEISYKNKCTKCLIHRYVSLAKEVSTSVPLCLVVLYMLYLILTWKSLQLKNLLSTFPAGFCRSGYLPLFVEPFNLVVIFICLSTNECQVSYLITLCFVTVKCKLYQPVRVVVRIKWENS